MAASVRSSVCAVDTAPSVETMTSGWAGRAPGPGSRAAVIDSVLGLVTGGTVVWGTVAVNAGAELVLVAGGAGSVGDPGKAGLTGTSDGKLLIGLVESVDKDTKLEDLVSVTIFSWYGVLWLLASAVWLLWNITVVDSIVDVWTEVPCVSLALCRTRVEDAGGKVVCETECGAGLEAIKDIGKGDGEDDKAMAASEVDSS